jgi:hypothetical protein
MLKEIQCPFFNHNGISFHEGLNIILGDDDAKNSIGKSTALMVIDFAHGGDSFLKDEAGAIRALGHHFYNFSFVFVGRCCSFSRSTNAPDIVWVCDDSYARQRELPVEDYRRMLKELYGLAGLENSFRAIVSPFARIWRKGGLEPDQPFISNPKEPSGLAISRLIDLFERSMDIASEKEVMDELKERRKLIIASMNANIIPSINSARYKENSKTIVENAVLVEQLKQGVGGALNAYEALFDEDLRVKQQRKNEVTGVREELYRKLDRLRREISGVTPRLAANIALVAEFFPNVNLERLEQVEVFHHKIGSILKKELKDEFASTRSEESSLTREIDSLGQQIQATLNAKGMPDDVFRRIYDLKEVTDKAVEENKYFEQKVQLEKAIKIAVGRLNEIYVGIFLEVEAKINRKLKAFNKVVYGPSRNSSELRIKSASSYTFGSPDDTGTGKSYAGLIGFDLAMLSLTKLPFIMHDSVVYKNIEVVAIQRILRILASIKYKQVFLSFDEARKFGLHTEQQIRKFSVLKLSHDDLLYNKDWRDKK